MFCDVICSMTAIAYQIEGVPHLLRGQDVAGEYVADDPDDGHGRLWG